MNISTSQFISDNSSAEDIVFPISIEIDPMERLLLVNFEKDPDSIYLGFEPQVFNDNINGKGHLIIGWRKDKKIDVYHQNSLSPDPSKYSIAGAGLNEMRAVDMVKSVFEINDFGVQADYQFNDILGREVKIHILENNARKRKPFGLLAPMGDSATHPTSMPMVWLHDFYFVRKKHTQFQVFIDNRAHQPDDLPIRMDGNKMTFARYSPRPLIATLNPEYQGEIRSMLSRKEEETIEEGNRIYTLEWVNQRASIKSMTIKNDIHPLSLSFSPAFPCLNTIASDSRHLGKFSIFGHESLGSISGEYSIQSVGDSIHLSIVPSNGWKPKMTKLSTWFLFNVVKVFKKWPATYQWDAHLIKRKEGIWQMDSKWIRTGKILKD